VDYLKQFRYVMTIAQEKSISRAAERLGVTQPTLSKYILKLEEELGMELFNRNTFPITLTQAGECFVAAGEKMCDIHRQMEKRLDTIRKNNSIEVRLGIGPSRSVYLLPEILAEYKKTNPDNRIVVQEGMTADISSKLLNGQLDMVISLLDENTEQFDRVELFEETVLLAVHEQYAEHVEAAVDSNGKVHLTKIENVPFITVGKGQYLRNVLNELRKKDDEPAYECHNIESAMALVRAGIGITLAPSYIRDYGEHRASTPIRFYEISPAVDERIQNQIETMLNRKVCMFCRREQFLSHAEKELIACCQKVCIDKSVNRSEENDTCNPDT